MSDTRSIPKGRNGGSSAPAKRPEAADPGASHDASGHGRQGAITTDPIMRASQLSLIGLFGIALLWCAYVAQPVLVPLLLAWAIATIMQPVVRWLRKRGIPQGIAALIVTLLLLALIAGVLTVLSGPFTYWFGRVTELAALLKAKLQLVGQPLVLLDELRESFSSMSGNKQPALKVEREPATVATVVSVVTPAVSQFILFVGALIFYLVYQKKLRDTAVFFLKERSTRLMALRTLSDVDDHMTTFFGTFTIVNFCLGLATAVLTWSLGLPNPLLWGVLAGVLNYVPYIGPALVTGTLGVVGLLVFSTLGEAVIAPLIFLAMVTVEGQFITPAFMGRRLEINPFAVFLSVALWTWLWGPVGAFLAVPLLIAFSVTLSHAFSDSKPQLPE